MPKILAYIVLYTLVFIMGACVGSFYNVITLRLPVKESFTKGRSHCPKCGHKLSVLDLVPFFSYIFLKGKCRYCKEHISIRYPIMELVGGITAVLCFLNCGYTLNALLAFYVVSVLITLSVIDFETKIIPNGFHIALLVAVVASVFLEPEISWQSRLIGFFAISAPMLILGVTVGGFGGGDIKLMAVAGALLGWQGVLCAFIVGIFAALFYCIYILAKKNGGRKTEIAFGPYLSIGIIISYFFAEKIISLYFGIFLY